MEIEKSSMDGSRIPLVWAGENCDLTREQAAEERLEQKRRRLLAIKEFKASNRPRLGHNFKVTRVRVPVTVSFSDCLPEGRVLPGILARAKERNKDLGESSEENQKREEIHQWPVTEAFANLQN